MTLQRMKEALVGGGSHSNAIHESLDPTVLTLQSCYMHRESSAACTQNIKAEVVVGFSPFAMYLTYVLVI